jgi:eukaryotic-like serine/threonine-protein kinase
MLATITPSACRVVDLVDPEHIREAEYLQSRCLSPADLAAELAQADLITPFQARWLGRGDGRKLAVGPYVLLDRLGTGGMGEVFLARHRSLFRRVALKVVRAVQSGNVRAEARFLQEVWAAGRFDHPHVVHAYDAGRDRGQYWLALAYVPGPDLHRLVREAGPLPPDEACRYAGQAARGLQHIHELGMVHRDVKPSNLMLDEWGRVKVMDVGLAGEGAFRSSKDDGLTVTGRLLGSIDCIAPEQVEDARRAGPPADQYALGATLYYLLTGEPPFPDGTRMQRALARLAADPVPVQALRPGVPDEVAAVVQRLMARRPKDRFTNLAEAAVALEALGATVVRSTSDTVESVSLSLSETRF